MSTVTLFLDIDGGAVEVADLVESIHEIDTVADVEARAEDAERAPSTEPVESITLTVTAIGGAAPGMNLLLDQLKSTIGKAKSVRRAWVDTPAGPEPVKGDG